MQHPTNRRYEIRLEELTEAETATLLEKLAEIVSAAQVYENGAPIMWGLIPAEQMEMCK